MESIRYFDSTLVVNFLQLTRDFVKKYLVKDIKKKKYDYLVLQHRTPC
jgi:hypothetical protein